MIHIIPTSTLNLPYVKYDVKKYKIDQNDQFHINHIVKRNKYLKKSLKIIFSF